MKKLLILFCLFSALFFVGCKSNTSAPETPDTEQTPAEESGDKSIVVKDMKGDVSIPANPQRIVDISGSADELIIMGIPFVGSANTSMFDGTTVPEYLQDYFKDNNVETVGNYGGIMDLDLEKIANLKPDLIIMNIRYDKVYDQLQTIAPTLMVTDEISYVNWRARFKQLGDWFDKKDIVTAWLEDYDNKAAELSKKIQEVTNSETFAVIESNSVHMGSYYVYRTGGPGDLIFNEFKLNPSSGVPEDVWGEVVDAEYFSKIDADHIFFFSDNGEIGETGDIPTWQNMKAVKNGNVYYGINNEQYNMAYTPNGKSLYMEKLANAIINHVNVN